jgi:hypothetical protein
MAMGRLNPKKAHGKIGLALNIALQHSMFFLSMNIHLPVLMIDKCGSSRIILPPSRTNYD